MSAPFRGTSYTREVVLQTAAQWAETTDRVLLAYQTGRESDTGYEKTGPGVWIDLDYDVPSSWAPGMRFVDPDLLPFSGALVTVNPVSIGSNPGGENDQGTYLVPEHFIGSNVDFKLSASGANKFYYGHNVNLILGGPYTGSPSLIGYGAFVNNRLHTSTGTPKMIGFSGAVSVEGDATYGIGVDASAYGGSVVACPLLIGGQFVGMSGHVSPTTMIGVRGKISNAGDGGIATTTGVAKAVHAMIEAYSSISAITDARGVSLDSWLNNHTVTTSYGIYADSSIDLGTTKYFIYSLSASPSMITGAVGIGGEANANAMLDVQSTTKAFMPPRMTTTQKNAIASPTAGMVVYDSTLNKLCVYTGAAWQTVTSA